MGTLIFLENLAGGTLIRVGLLIRHCIVEGPVLTSLYFPSSKKHEVFVKFVEEVGAALNFCCFCHIFDKFH